MTHLTRPIARRGRRTSTWFTLFAAQSDSSLSLRDRICATIRGAIQSGHVGNGDRLPSTRVLAADLRVSRVTAEAAYEQLEAEGYVRRRVGDGTFVDIDVQPNRISALTRPAPQRPDKLEPSWSSRGRRIIRGGACTDPTEAVAFSAGFPDLTEFPVETWRRLTARCLRRDARLILGYGNPAGEPALRAAVARYLAQSRRVSCGPEQVIILTSSQQALHLVATLLTETSDTVWIEEPGYRGAKTALAAMGAKLQPIPVDGDGLTMPNNGSSRRPRLIYVTPSHQYPIGVTLTLPRRLALIEYARRCGAWIVEDDYDSEFQFDGRSTPSMQGLDDGGRILYVGTFSKVLFPSLRLAYLVAPESLVDGFVRARTTQDGHSARLSQLVTADFIDEGHFAAHVRRMRQLYHHRRDLLLSEINQRLQPWCRPIGFAAGLQLTVALPRKREASLTRAAAMAGVVTPVLSDLFLSKPTLDGWILGFAALPDEAIVEGVRRLSTLAR
jgi:GntR family transcriptional regulator/MocR family aminotransferase